MKLADQEDEYLREFHAKIAPERSNLSIWEALSIQMQTAGYAKTAKQCRERWAQHLDPSLCLQKWNNEDNQLLFSLQSQYGNKWKDIALHFPHRTDNGVKNQFFSLVRKSIRRALKISEVPFSNELVNIVKPKVLSDFLDRTLPSHPTHSSQSSPKDAAKNPTGIKVRALIERYSFVKITDKAGKLTPTEKTQIREALQLLEQMK